MSFTGFTCAQFVLGWMRKVILTVPKFNRFAKTITKGGQIQTQLHVSHDIGHKQGKVTFFPLICFINILSFLERSEENPLADEDNPLADEGRV